MDFLERNVILRVVKAYAGEHTHVYAGRVVGFDNAFVCIDGRVFHFARPNAEDPTGGMTSSPRAIRWVPVQRIEYMRDLPERLDIFSPDAFRLTPDGTLRAVAFPA